MHLLVNAARVGHQLHGLDRSYFWAFLETKSVLATGMVAGTFLVTTVVSGIWFGGP